MKSEQGLIDSIQSKLSRQVLNLTFLEHFDILVGHFIDISANFAYLRPPNDASEKPYHL